MTPIVVFRNLSEARHYGRDISGAIVVSASMPHSMRIICSPTVFVSEGVAAVPGLLDTVRKRQESFKDATLEIMPAEHIRMAFGSAHDKLRLAAITGCALGIRKNMIDP